MARPRRRELDYITIDVKLDRKMQLLEAAHGLVGFAIWVKLLQRIYGDEGYFMRWTPDDVLLFAHDMRVDAEKIEAVVDDCIKRGIFDAGQYQRNGILTSHGIQERYLFACTSRTGEKIRPEYALINDIKIVSNDKTTVSDSETAVLSAEMPHTIPYNNKQNNTIVNNTTSTGNSGIWEEYPEGGGGLTISAQEIMWKFFGEYEWTEAQREVFEHTLTEQKGCDNTGKPIHNLRKYMSAWNAKLTTGYLF